MKVAWATIGCLVWFGIMVAAFVIAIGLAWRPGVRGIIQGLVVLVGAVLSGAWVSAIIGLYEVPDYATQWAFWSSLTTGALGPFISFFAVLVRAPGKLQDLSSKKANGKSDRPEPTKASPRTARRTRVAMMGRRIWEAIKACQPDWSLAL